MKRVFAIRKLQIANYAQVQRPSPTRHRQAVEDKTCHWLFLLDHLTVGSLTFLTEVGEVQHYSAVAVAEFSPAGRARLLPTALNSKSSLSSCFITSLA